MVTEGHTAAQELSQQVAEALSIWSLAVHIGIVVVILVVNIALWLASRREVLLTWVTAWLADTLALSSVLVFAFIFPSKDWVALYGAGKICFALLLVRGFLMFNRDRLARIHLSRYWAVGFAGLFGLSLLGQPSGFAQSLTFLSVGSILGIGALLAGIRSPKMNAWFLTIAAVCAGALFVHHGVVLFHSPGTEGAPTYMSYVSFIDLFGEYLIGVACFLALGQRALSEMQQTNRELETAQGTLRALVDADPLTGLYNRRRLRTYLVASANNGGSLLYLDIDNFKGVNDRWGHMAGDRSLRHFAEQMREVFRAEDGLFRLGGDEFLVVAPGLRPAAARSRVTELRRLIGSASKAEVPIGVSCGIVEIEPNVPMEEALALADTAMYRDKKDRRERSR